MFISLNFFIRKPGLTWEEFSWHWRDVHGPLIVGTPSIARHVKRYVQHHLAPNLSAPDAQPLPFDGFAELWFDRMEDRLNMFAEPDFARIVTPDAHRFLDKSVIPTSMSDVQVVQAGVDIAPAIAAGAHTISFK